jgi:ATP-binding cassette, subfamily B, bacterial HlyB/CyaB
VQLIPSLTAKETGLHCLQLLAGYHDVAIDIQELQHQLALLGDQISPEELIRAGRYKDLKAKIVRTHFKRLPLLELPAIYLKKNGTYAIIARLDESRVLVQNPALPTPSIMEKEAFCEEWTGDLIQITTRASEIGKLAKFDFSWFIPAFIRYRHLLKDILIASVFVQAFALITPLFFQVVMDKVLVHQGYSTLTVVAVGLFFVSCFESILTLLRTYILSHTTCRIDVELGTKLFRHLISLPISYFESRRVGDSIARVQELENIRQFLTGSAMTALLDMAFSVVFIAVMFFYSVPLTFIVLASLPIYAIISFFITPILRKNIEALFSRGAESQSFLVESVSGVGTIKAMAVEPQMIRRWDNLIASYTKSLFSVLKLSAVGNEGINLVHKLVTVAIMWMGADIVIKGEMSVGQLIAFNMLSGQVAAPIIRLAQLWQEFQRTIIAVDRIGDILNQPVEQSSSKASTLPPIVGHLHFDQVRFRYRPDSPEVLKGVTFEVLAGEVIGIVGPSGSGKSTITKLIQRLHSVESGRVMLDGVDLRLVDPAWLRRQLGVVLQENLLFRRTVRENISLQDPSMPFEKVVEAAQLAAAHEFILELPQQYDTLIEEHGSNLSGGQRQRLAIARALVGNPKVLIFDEATSALDYESESAVMNNMKLICKNRTVVIIAHRLSTIAHANRIIVMQGGQVVETGTHHELVAAQGAYHRLLQFQVNMASPSAKKH